MTLVAWSGGLDSSILIYDVLSNWFGDDKYWGEYELKKEYRSPRTFSIESPQFNDLQMIKQKQSRDKQIAFYKKKNWNFKHHNININYNGLINGAFPQPLMFLQVASMIIENEEPLFLGWIRQDDATKNLDYFSDLWDKMTKINGKTCPLFIPYNFFKKSEIINSAKSKGIFNKSWWCEMPIKTKRGTIKACLECNSCLDMVGANAIISHQNKIKSLNYVEIKNVRV